MAASSVFLFGCPLAGDVIPISQCQDPTFAQGLLGPGVVISPRDCRLFAPADATVEFILSTKHALGLATSEGIKFLLHVGLDTNRLGGQGFLLHARAGDKVRRGEELLSFDPHVMAANGCSLDTPFVFCSPIPGWQVDVLQTGYVPAGTDLLRVTLPPGR